MDLGLGKGYTIKRAIIPPDSMTIPKVAESNPVKNKTLKSALLTGNIR
jgi:hypothetical protein